MTLTPTPLTGAAILRLQHPAPGIEDFFVLLHGETTLGRHPANRICLPRKTVSRFHARITKGTEGYMVEDLESSNGTFVNGKQITREALRNNDELTLGELKFSFYLDEESSQQISLSDSSIRLRQSVRENTDEILSVQAVEDARQALTSLEHLESIPLASQYLKAHYRLLDIIRQRPSQDRLLHGFLEIVADVVQADRGVIMLYPPHGDEILLAASWNKNPDKKDEAVSISKTILDRAVQDQVSVLSRDVSRDERFSAAESVILQQVRSAICAPLVIRGRVLGACYLDIRQSGEVFNDQDLAFITHLSSQLALALDNLRMTLERIQEEHMAVIGQTMAEVSHSIKNIMLITKGGADILEQNIQSGNLNDIQRTWKVVRNGMDRMHNLAVTMLDYSRNEPRNCKEVDLVPLLKDLAESLETDLEGEDISLKAELEDNLPLVWLCPQSLHEALMNLVSNARDALEDIPHKEITLRARLLPEARVEVSICDNGPGIDPEIREQVFAPFFSTKGGRGNGMGLAMVHKFAREMGGNARLHSETGKGTQIILTFPVHNPDALYSPSQK